MAGAEIYYDHLIYHMNPHLRENSGNKDAVFALSGDIPKEFSNQIMLVYDEQKHKFMQDPKPALIHLGHDTTITVLNESNLDYNVTSYDGQTSQVVGTLDAGDSWSHDFDRVGSYSYGLKSQNEHGNRYVDLQILVIDEPIKDIPKSIRHAMACRLMSVDYSDYPFYTGRSGCGSSDHITMRFDKVVMGTSPQYKEELLDRIAQDARFLEPEIIFEYEGSDILWILPFPHVFSSLAQQEFLQK